MRNQILDTSTTKTNAAAASTVTWTNAEGVPKRFHGIILETSALTFAEITALRVRGGGTIVEIDSNAKLLAYINRFAKNLIPATVLVAQINFGFAEPRLKGMAELKNVSDVQLDLAGNATSATWRIAFMQVQSELPRSIRVVAQGMSLGSGVGQKLPVPEFSGALKSMFIVHANYTRLQVKHARMEPSLILDARKAHLQAWANSHGYENTAVGTTIGYDFDENGDLDGLLTRDGLEIIAETSAAESNSAIMEFIN